MLLGIARDRANQIRIRTCQDRVGRLDNRHLAPQGAINGSKFHADIAAADHQKILRNLGNFQGFRGCHDPGIAQIKGSRQGRTRSNGNDGLVEVDKRLMPLRLHAEAVGRFEVRAPMDHLNSALLSKPSNALAEFSQDGVLPSSKLLQMNFGSSEDDPSALRAPSIVNQLGGMQQGFRRNASPVQTNAAQALILLDQDDLLT